MQQKKKLLIFTDTYAHQINGAKVTLEELARNAWKNTEIVIVSGDDFRSVPFPTYAEVRFAMVTPRRIRSILRKEKPDMIHIMTEWTIGFAAARACQKLKMPYTSAFHTKFPEYIALRVPFIEEKLVHRVLRFIHNGSSAIIVSSEHMKEYLEKNKYPIEKIRVIPFGVDHTIFFPGEKTLFHELSHPILLFVWRIAIEKNIGDFLSIDTLGTKVVVWDGPLRQSLERNFPEVYFLGFKDKKELWEIYRSADIFVFPSLTDTLGLVNIEALACGIPVLAYDVEWPDSVITHGKDGILVHYGKPLNTGISEIFSIKREDCIKKADIYNWWDYSLTFLASQSIIPKDTWT